MLRTLCKSKIQRVITTETALHYEGSITVDKTLMIAADIMPYERVQVLNMNTGARLETYVIEGEADAGIICMNGPAARCAEVGDKLVIVSYVMLEDAACKDFKPKIVIVDDNNKVKTLL